MYDLHRLGWDSFQRLCLTITREVLGQAVESFLDTSDGGRDGAFAGTWNPTGNEILCGRFVIQCKFTSKRNYVLRVSDLSDEVAKVERLVQQGICDTYVLMTNAGVSGKQAEKIEALFTRAGATHVVFFGSTWICQQIRENKRLRMLVPRLYGFGDLSQILDERAYAQARALLESMREDLAKVVVTGAYRRAAAALDAQSFVLLIGEPAAGKTTIASLLAMAAVDQWGASVLKLDEPRTVVDRWNPEEPSQLFWLDDAFGVTQYEALLVHGWNHILPQVRTMLRRGAKVVMTSRDYIYSQARNDVKESAFPLLEESQVVIDVQDLSPDEKRQILYNHLKLSNQPRQFRHDVKPHLESVAAHPRFIPEMARRLADPFVTVGLRLDAFHLGEFVEKRERFLQEVLRGLDGHSKAALAMIYMRNDRLKSPVSLQTSEEQALERLGSNIGGCVAALQSLNGSVVLHSHASGDSIWRFKHPTIGDAYATLLVQNPELLGIFVLGSAPDKLVEQVTCGDVGIERAVVVPKVLFPVMIDRLRGFVTSKEHKSKLLSDWHAISALQRFLARRCSKEFLSLYLDNNPELLDKVSRPGLYLSAVSEVGLAVRLHDFGLLPEDKRRTFVAAVSKYAVRGDDVYALQNVKIRALFENQEFEELLENVRIHLLPRLDEVRLNVQSDYSGNVPPDEHMQQLLDAFVTLEKHFGDDAAAGEIIEQERRLANDWISEHMPEEVNMTPRTLGSVEDPDEPRGIRSIFDDVDA